MKLMIICSTSFYNKLQPIIDKLECLGHELLLPNQYDGVNNEHHYEKLTDEEYIEFFKTEFTLSRNKIASVDGVFAINFSKEKNGKILENYIGASTFLEMYEAFMGNKKIFLLNEIPNNMLYDEIKGFNPIIVKDNFDIIK